MELSNKLQAQQFEIKNFTYDLPENRIAKYPLAERDLSKLLVYKNERISEDIYRNLDKYINEKSLLVFNNTKVIQARLHFSNSKGGKIEIYLTEIEIKVQGLEKIKVPVGFIKSNSVNGLLGQIGFFCF